MDGLQSFHAELASVFGDIGTPSLSPDNALCCSSAEAETPCPSLAAQRAGSGLGFGGEADIDLYIGHLDTSLPTDKATYRERYSDALEGFYYLVSVDSYGKGYSDGTVTKHEYPALRPKADRTRISKCRNDMSDSDRRKSEQRAKTQLRKKTTMLKPIDMLTLTFGEQVYDRSEAYKILHRFVRVMSDRFGEFDYVAVAERHKKGGIHFHLAITKKYHWNTVRYIWRKATGTDKGNVHFSNKGFARGGCSVKTAIRIAGYITKYFSKDDASELYEKRYSSSRGIPKPRKERYYIPIVDYTFELVKSLISEVTGKIITQDFEFDGDGRIIRWFKTY